MYIRFCVCRLTELLTVQFSFAVLGVLVLVVVAVDVVWTTIGTHGGGPVSKHVTRGLWHVTTALHRATGRRHHFALSFAGSLILIAIVIFWIALTAAGWLLIFSSNPNAIVDSHTRQPADLGGRFYFVAYAMSTMGNGDFQPASTTWRIVTSIATLSGITTVTLVVTFILAVLSAVVEKRALAALISDMGSTPARILRRAWSGEKFDGLESYLVQLTGMLHVFVEQHLAYPVLHYFHSETTRTAASVRLNALHDTLLLLARGTDPSKRLGRMTTEPLLEAFDALAHVFRQEFIAESDDEPPAPSLDVLRDAGIPAVSDDEFRDAVKRSMRTRKTLLGLLEDDGWTWTEVG